MLKCWLFQDSVAEGESTDLEINYEKLKVQEKILFFDEVPYTEVPAPIWFNGLVIVIGNWDGQ